MKKGNVLQLAIIIMGLLLGYTAVQYIISAAVAFITELGRKEGYIESLKGYAAYLLIVLMYGVICWQLIKYSKQLSDYIIKKSGYQSPLVLSSNPVDLLYLLLVVTGIYSLLDKGPGFLKAVINSFTERAAPRLGDFTEQSPIGWMQLILNTALPLLLLIFARPIAAYFAKDISDTPITIRDGEADAGQDEKEEGHLLDEQ